MLPGLTLPASWRSLLEVFRPAFRRGSTFALFALLATGLAARTTRRTVVGMLAGAGMAAAVSFHSACRFFSHHAWDVDPIGLVLARLIVDRLLPDGAPITVVVDDTLFRRWGPKVHAAYWTHDGSAQDPNALGRGNRWVIVGIVVTLPFCTRPVCLPVLLRLWRGNGTASPVTLAGEMISLLAQAFPDRRRARSRGRRLPRQGAAGRAHHDHHPAAGQRRARTRPPRRTPADAADPGSRETGSATPPTSPHTPTGDRSP